MPKQHHGGSNSISGMQAAGEGPGRAPGKQEPALAPCLGLVEVDVVQPIQQALLLCGLLHLQPPCLKAQHTGDITAAPSPNVQDMALRAC